MDLVGEEEGVAGRCARAEGRPRGEDVAVVDALESVAVGLEPQRQCEGTRHAEGHWVDAAWVRVGRASFIRGGTHESARVCLAIALHSLVHFL